MPTTPNRVLRVEVLRARPRGEGALEALVVAKLPQAIDELCRQVGVDVEPLLARRPPEEQVVQPVDALQLFHGLRVVVDAQVDQHVAEPRVPAFALDDEQRGRLLPAPVAARRLRCVEAVEQPPGERA